MYRGRAVTATFMISLTIGLLTNGLWYVAIATGTVSMLLFRTAFFLKKWCVLVGYVVDRFEVVSVDTSRRTKRPSMLQVVREGDMVNYVLPVGGRKAPSEGDIIKVYYVPDEMYDMPDGRKFIPYVYGFETYNI